MTRHFPLLALILLGMNIAGAQVPIPKADSVSSIRGLSLAGYPYIFYSPETEFALGGALVATYRTTDSLKAKPSNFTLSGYYSVKSQYDIYFVPEAFFEEGKYYLTGFIDYGRYVDKFWGIGNDVPDIPEAPYVRTFLAVNVDFQVRIVEELKIGLNYDFNTTTMTDKQANPFLLADAVTGSNGGLSSGLGISLSYDKRDNVFWPSAGLFYKLNTVQCIKWLGSDFEFNRIIIDLRQYIGLGEGSVLGVNVYGNRVAGPTPFYQMPLLGGGYIMRGYYLGRYRDNYYVAAQAEYRWMFARRWGVIAFIGAGDVAAEMSGFQIKYFKPNAGFGLRFALDPEEKLNVRVDFSYGRDAQGNPIKGIYFNVKEAF